MTPLIFPDDENGDVLRRMYQHGDNLVLPRDIDFSVIFRSKRNAMKFADHFRSTEQNVDIDKADTEPGFPWDVTVTRHMLPEHAQISAFEDELQAIAEPLGGRNDGWGCWQQD